MDMSTWGLTTFTESKAATAETVGLCQLMFNSKMLQTGVRAAFWGQNRSCQWAPEGNKFTSSLSCYKNAGCSFPRATFL